MFSLISTNKLVTENILKTEGVGERVVEGKNKMIKDKKYPRSNDC